MSRFIRVTACVLWPRFRAMLSISSSPTRRISSVSVTVPGAPSPAIKPMNGCNQPVMKCTAYSKRRVNGELLWLEPRRSLYGRPEKCGIQRCWSPVFTKTTHRRPHMWAIATNVPTSGKGRPRLPQNPLPDVLGWKYSGNRHHPTEKPVTSLQPLIESFTHPNAIVLDPFAGSGSTCVAALQSGRRYIGIELLEQYHRAGQQRLAAVQRAMQQGPRMMTGLCRRLRK